MDSIPNNAGVYILVLNLNEETTITFDRKGSNRQFAPGWYMYVGSACGSGGLNRRLARHRRRHASGKRMHWNVDYFREHATLCEVWFRETCNSDVEHQWAEATQAARMAAIILSEYSDLWSETVRAFLVHSA